MIDLYSDGTPNGWKISVALEEMSLPYTVHHIQLPTGEQKKEWYTKLNPNSKIPTIVDRDNGDFTIFESGAILLYLAEKSGMLMPQDVKGRSLVTQWLMFQVGHIGPMQGQVGVFTRYFPEKIQSVIDRFQNEVRRLCEVLDKRLGEVEYLAVDYSIADIAHWCWIRFTPFSGVDISDLNNLNRWIQTISERPAVQRGMQIPVGIDIENMSEAEIEEKADKNRKLVTR